MAEMIGSQIERLWNTHTPEATARRTTRWLERNERARFYHHLKRKLLPPLKNQLNL